MKLALAAATLLLLPLTCAAQTTCPTASTAATQAIRLRHQLLITPVPQLEGLFPRKSGYVFEHFKQTLIRVTDETLACEPADTTASGVQQHLAVLLHANRPQPRDKVTEDDKPETNVLGADLRVRVNQSPDFPQLLTVQIGSGIPCSDDNMLIVYERSASGWKEALLWRTYDLWDDNHAFGDFFLSGILPGPTPGSWRALAVHGFPNCTSRFSGFLMDVLEPRPGTTKPRVVWHGDEGYSRGEVQPRLRIFGDVFEVRPKVPAINIDDFERTGVFRYLLKNDHVTRIDPIAVNARETVDEWLDMHWPEARRHVDPGAETQLQAVHRKLQQPKGDKAFLKLRHGPVRTCKASNHFQVEVDGTLETFIPNVPGGNTDPVAPAYFQLLETGNGYQILSASKTPSPNCTGPNLMKDKQ